ncbi:MAG: hypothetical protein ACT4P8_01950 [Betaproteobacteria bacterium]
MKNTWIVLFSGALLFASVPTDAQKVTRIRGAITAFDGNVLTVKVRDSQISKVLVVDKTEIVFTQPITISDIKAGDFLGVTSAKGPDGSLTAFEIRRFPKPVNPGHRPFDGRDDQTMTNATVSAVVQATKGRELTLTYEGGSQKIVVPEDASITMLVPGERAHFVPGAIVNLTATPGADGQLAAQRIQVSKPKPTQA